MSILRNRLSSRTDVPANTPEKRKELKWPFATILAKVALRRHEVEAIPACVSGYSTVASSRHPEVNYDAVLADDHHGVWGVFDGVGGNPEVAQKSHIAAEETQHQLAVASEFAVTTAEEAEGQLRQALIAANDRIHSGDDKSPATTAAVMKYWKGANSTRYMSLAHTGDSRIYRLTRGGELECLTLDHGLFRIVHPEDKGKAKQLQDHFSEARKKTDIASGLRGLIGHLHKIGAGLGGGSLDIDTLTVAIAKGDRFCVVSDGIGDNLTPKEIAAILATESATPLEIAESLTAAAVERSQEGVYRSKPDDTSAVVVVF